MQPRTATQRLTGMPDFSALPEECISHILSLLSPRDVCRLSSINSVFRSAAQSDTIWQRFLPFDYDLIISRAVSTVAFTSKRDLYFNLSDSPILIDGGNKSFALDKPSGKKCYMLGARDLSIAWENTLQLWNWVRLPKSAFQLRTRFTEVACLEAASCLEIIGKIEKKMLSPNTNYTACLVYMVVGRFGILEHPPVKVSLKFVRGVETTEVENVDSSIAYLQPRSLMNGPEQRDGQRPRLREDGWKELTLGEFFNDSDGMVEMSLEETETMSGESGFIVQGIELRPQESYN